MAIISVDLLQKLIQEIRKTFPRSQGIYLFGSFAHHLATAASDLDIAILVPKIIEPYTLFLLASTCRDIVKRDVDLVDLRSASTVFQMQIISQALRIDCQDMLACERFEDLVYAKYIRLNDMRQYILEDVQKRGHIY